MKWLIKRLGLRAKLVAYAFTLNEAVPLRDIITLSEDGELFLQGKAASMGDVLGLREAATTALNNRAFNLIREQVQYESFVGAATKAVTGEDLIFYRAALWWGQQMESHLKLLAQKQEPDL